MNMLKRKKYITIYVDMDDTIADFNGVENAVARFREEPNFFFKLKPLEKNLNAIKQALENPIFRVFILTASPNERCDNDKRLWLAKYLPKLPKKNIICCRIGENKGDYMKYKGSLLDDYGKNVRQWQETTKCNAYKIEYDGKIENVLNMLVAR